MKKIDIDIIKNLSDGDLGEIISRAKQLLRDELELSWSRYH